MIHYIICCKYIPSSAACNRIRLFGKGFEAIGCNCRIHYLDFGQSRIQKVFATIKHIFGLFYLASKLTKKDVLIIYGETPLTLLYSYIAKRTNFLIEKTEYPLHLIIKDLPLITYKRSVRNLHSYYKAHGLITCSTALRNYFHQFNEEIFISPLIVDLNEFSGPSDNHNRPIAEKYIAYCGSLNNNKDGVPTLIRAFCKFHTLYNDIKLVIIGPGSQNTLNELTSLISAYNLTSSVVLTGAIPHEELSRWLKSAVMLALARPNNKQAEGGMPSKVGEYLASGVPCVITNVGDLHLYFEDGRDCYIAEPDSVESFANKMVQCYNSNNTNLIKNAISTVAQFDYKEQARDLLNYILKQFPDVKSAIYG